MLKLSELLVLKERRLINRLSLVVGIVILFLIFSLFFWSHKLNAIKVEAGKLTAELEKISQQTEQSQLDFRRWQETKKDLEELKRTAFYSGEDGLEAYRQDLRALFQQAGLPMPAVSYQYEEQGNRKFKRLAASFGLNFSYPVFKRFLYQLETWPRLLLLDQINFQKIDNVSGNLQVRITLSGYYYGKE
ncbi:MAG: hypothetical protein ACPLRA_07355 [Candidatus Saccharicenans sp.]